MAKRSSPTLVNQWLANPSKDLLSGLVVAFAMIPEAIAFSGIAGVDPKVGLFGAFCLSLTIAVVGGRMAMITSACLLYTSPSPRDGLLSRMPSSA